MLETMQTGTDMTAAFPLLKLSAGDTEVAIAPHRGAIVTSFRVAGRELLYLDEATFNDASKNVRGGIPVLFPSPGKLEGDRWNQAGKSGELKQHGFARNLEWQVGATTASSVTLSLRSSDATVRMYPWSFAAQVTYRVAPNELHIGFEVRNESAAPMPFAFGLHPYFAVHDKARARIPTRATRAFDNVAKAVVPFAGFDLTQSEVDLHLLDHGASRGVLELSDRRAIVIETSPEFSRWVVWTVAGKDYVCLEPWTAPGNALNTGEGVIVIEPQKHHTLWTKITYEERT
jgi:galactose mutarotase-like enzyme